MSPFSCQAKRDIKYFPSRARNRSGDLSARERRYQQGRRERERERERERRREEGEKDKETENCASRENGKPENDHRLKAHATPFPYHSFDPFFLFLSFIYLFFLTIFLSLDTTPAFVRGQLVELYQASLHSGVSFSLAPSARV